MGQWLSESICALPTEYTSKGPEIFARSQKPPALLNPQLPGCPRKQQRRLESSFMVLPARRNGKGRKDGSQSYPNRLNTAPQHCPAPGWPNPCQNSGIKHMEKANRPTRAAKPELQNINKAKPAQKWLPQKISQKEFNK